MRSIPGPHQRVHHVVLLTNGGAGESPRETYVCMTILKDQSRRRHHGDSGVGGFHGLPLRVHCWQQAWCGDLFERRLASHIRVMYLDRASKPNSYAAARSLRWWCWWWSTLPSSSKPVIPFTELKPRDGDAVGHWGYEKKCDGNDPSGVVASGWHNVMMAFKCLWRQSGCANDGTVGRTTVVILAVAQKRTRCC